MSRPQRIEMANDGAYDLFVSIHYNGNIPEASGFEVLVYRDTDRNCRGLAEAIVEAAGVNGIKLRREAVKGHGADVLALTNMPAVMVEGGFMSDDLHLIITEEYQRLVAYSTFMGIVNFVGHPHPVKEGTLNVTVSQ